MLIILTIVHKYTIHMYDCVCLRPWVSLYIYIYIYVYICIHMRTNISGTWDASNKFGSRCL